MTVIERKDHAIRQHGFPSDYRYDHPLRKSKNNQEMIMTSATSTSGSSQTKK